MSNVILEFENFFIMWQASKFESTLTNWRIAMLTSVIKGWFVSGIYVVRRSLNLVVNDHQDIKEQPEPGDQPAPAARNIQEFRPG